MDKSLNIPELLPSIEDYLSDLGEDLPIDLSDHEETIYKIRSHTGLEYETIKLILESYLKQCRSALINGYTVDISPIGYLYFPKRFKNYKKIRLKKKKFLKRKIFQKENE